MIEIVADFLQAPGVSERAPVRHGAGPSFAIIMCAVLVASMCVSRFVGRIVRVAISKSAKQTLHWCVCVASDVVGCAAGACVVSLVPHAHPRTFSPHSSPRVPHDSRTPTIGLASAAARSAHSRRTSAT